MEKTQKLKEFFRALKFLAFSISAGVIQFGTMALFYEVFKWEWWLSYIISLLLSVLWNFTINRKFTFKSANNVKIAMLLVLAFYAVFAPASLFLGDWIESLGVDGLIVEAGIMVLNFVLEFLYTRFVVYRNSCDTAVNKKEEKKGEN
ncbi:MAG: GtrA family protein [Clostridia bacterium]|nr:GtrA family protein [Clostridia bacterium]